MSLRVSHNQFYRQSQTNIARNYSSLFGIQQQLATGKRVNIPSDDPGGAHRIMGLDGEQQAIERYLSNVNSARSAIQSGAGNLLEVSDLIAQIQELAVQGANGALSAPDRRSVATEIDALAQNIVSALNIRVQGRYIFGGTATQTTPFEVLQGEDGLTRVEYHGNNDIQLMDVAPDLQLGLNIPGSQLLGGSRIPTNTTLTPGTTGAGVGAGNNSGSGRAKLLLVHEGTTYGSPSGAGGVDPVTGIRPAANTNGVDAILGNSHRISIMSDATGAGVISLNGGSDYPFSSSDTGLLIEGPNGESVRLDLSQVTPNLAFNTMVTATGTGSASLDGGTTRFPLDFTSSSQQISSSETDTIFHLDSTAISAAGEEDITFEGTFDLLDSIFAIRDALQDETDDSNRIGDRVREGIGGLKEGLIALTSSITVLGSRETQIDSVESRLGDLDVTLAGLRGSIEDADIAKAASDLSRYQTLYEASLALTSRLNGLSLLNYL